MKTCPECGDTDVIMFDSNNDTCRGCGKWFPAVKDLPEVFCMACTEAAGADTPIYHTGEPCGRPEGVEK